MTVLSSKALWLRWAAVPTALVASSALVWQGSQAAFSGSTDNGANSFASGTVSLSDDDAAVAMFNVSNLKPLDTGTKCITVTYNGSLAAAVKLYAANTGGLGTYLDLTVEQGTGGSSGSCAGFVAGSTLYNGTLAGLASSATNYGNGIAAFSPTGSGQNRTYRFTYTVQDNNAAQGLSSSATFTWEAQNS